MAGHLRPVSPDVTDEPIDEKLLAFINTLHRSLRELEAAARRKDWQTATRRALSISTLASAIAARCAHVLLKGEPEPHKAGRCSSCFQARPIGVMSELCDDCAMKR